MDVGWLEFMFGGDLIGYHWDLGDCVASLINLLTLIEDQAGGLEY